MGSLPAIYSLHISAGLSVMGWGVYVSRIFGIPLLCAIFVTSPSNLCVTMGAVGTPILSRVIAWPTTAGEQLLQ
ncbi:MAG: hypothetical protein PVG39_22675 [Desulfobacteraceae bacterium]